ncbi:MAG TPA: lipid A deacylase LpxR family protein [Stellaceae bacterium]|nr:lipid A deacylase LpxR family protein [Stellaceae bacterium]
MDLGRRSFASVLWAAVLTIAADAAHADSGWTSSILEEDDFWAPDNRDRHYTHGIRLSTASGDVHDDFWRAPFRWLTLIFPTDDNAARRYNLILLGQNMYTPEDFTRFNPNPRDRPYAGWLYSGAGLMQDTPDAAPGGIDRFDELALKLGIVGPGSLANQTQTRYHLLIDVSPFKGWHAQLRNEWAGDLSYEHKWRFHDEDEGGFGWDAIPQWSLRVGNVYDYAAVGGLLRFGRNLRVDYGPPHIDLNTGADYTNSDRLTPGTDWGFYFFFGGEARAVAHNIFLDGNDFKSSAHVDKIPAVGDLELGAAVVHRHFRLAYTYIYRSPEFIHQNAPDHYGALSLSFRLPF